MTPADLQNNERRLGLIYRLLKADAAETARILKSQSAEEVIATAHHADRIGRREVGKVLWDHVKKMGW